MKFVLSLFLVLFAFTSFSVPADAAMTKGQVKAMVANWDAQAIPDSAIVGIKTVTAEIMQLNSSSYAYVGQDADVSLDASDHWAPAISTPWAVYFKQD